MTSALYHRINELVEEVRSLKDANENLRGMNAKLSQQNWQLSNENSSIKFAAAASAVLGPGDMLSAAIEQFIPAGHATLSYGGTVAE